MASDLRTSETGLKLIMAYEGFRAQSKQLPDGRWVIGYGHTRAARQGLKVSQQEAAAILREFDLPPFEKALNELILVPVNQNEFDALASFAFNIGIDQFESSDVLARLNAGKRLDAAAAMECWRKTRVGARDMVVDPLVRRRAEEKALFLKPVGVVPLASSSRFRPMADGMNVSTPRSPAPAAPRARAAAPAPSQDTHEAEAASATEAAARTVRERLTRILGEQEKGGERIYSFEPETHGREASVDEIRAAISALVAEDEEEEAPSRRSRETGLEEIDPDIPDDDAGNDEAAVAEPHAERTPPQPSPRRGRGIYIDDVAPADIPPADPSLREPSRGEGPLEVFLFGVLALIGAGLFVYGGAMMFGWFDLSTDAEGDLAIYLPPFLMLFGGLLFLIMAYYCGRAIGSRKNR